MSIRVTVAVLTRDRLAHLRRCVDAVRAQLGPADEILVVDTGSRDGTPEWLASSPPRRVRLSPAPAEAATSYAAARNFAVSQALGEYLVFLDDDCTPAPGWLERMVDGMNSWEAVGGAVLPAREYPWPWWWSQELLWLIGMSAPGLLRGDADAYPATANMGARTMVWRTRPFAESRTGFDAGNVYLAGREDAEWWGAARRDGLDVRVDPDAVVYHDVPDSRLAWNAVIRRARADGTAAWQRDPRPDGLPDVLNESWAAALHPLLHPFDSLTRPGNAAASFAWAARQHAWVRAAHDDRRIPPGNRVAVHVKAAARMLLGGCRAMAGRAVDGAVLASRGAYRLPSSPGRVLVAAPTYLGDTILLQPVLRLFLENHPHAELAVWTRYPEMLSGALPQVELIADRSPAPDAVTGFLSRPGGCDAVFAPYYHFGDGALWRARLSCRGHVFDREHGFRRSRDLRLAARTVPKDLGRHELLNLRELFSARPLNGDLAKPVLAVQPEALERVRVRIGDSADRKLILVQLGSGNPIKNPADSLILDLCSRLAARDEAVIGLIGDRSQSVQADLITAALPPGRALNLCKGEPLDELVATISLAHLLIGPCSGPKHIAMALGVPTFTLYGPTGPEQWGAFFDQPLHGHIRSPRFRLTPRELIGLPPSFVMDGLAPEAVWAALQAHLDRLT